MEMKTDAHAGQLDRLQTRRDTCMHTSVTLKENNNQIKRKARIESCDEVYRESVV